MKLSKKQTRLLSIIAALGFYATGYARSQDDHSGHDHGAASSDEHSEAEDSHEGHDHGEESHSEAEEAGGHEGHDDGDEEESNMIRLSDKQLADFKVAIEEADMAELAVETILPGEIKLNQESMAHVSPRYEGIVTKILASLGDKVTAGQTLARLESNETLAPFDLVAPVDGTIVEFHITLGESVEAGRYLFIVADLEHLWVDLDIFQKDLGRVEKGQKVLVVAGHNNPKELGEISYVGPIVSEDTRTGLARLTIPNTDGKWKAGMFVTGHVTTETAFVPVAVKRTALQNMDGQTVVFVKAEGGFEPRTVTLGQQDSQFVEILSGVELGERYAAERSFVIKAQKEKANIDPHAGHNH
jgi:cobalt-zinc-cadmium efflux system membrane fusion protein